MCIHLEGIFIYYYIYDNITGYVKINRFSSTTSKEFQNAVDLLLEKGMQQLVIDLRNNGGGLMDEAIKMVDLFVSSNDKILVTKGKIIGSDNIYYASKKAPLNWGVANIGGTEHIGVVQFAKEAGIKVKVVPFGSGAQMVQALMAGKIDATL